MGFADNLAEMFGYGPSQQAAQQTNVNRAGQSNQLQQEYAQAQADPNSGIGLTPAMQQMQENELANHLRARSSDAGAGQSGAANDMVTKGIVDYRMAQMGKRMQHLDSLRQAMLQASTPQTQQPSVPQQAVSYGAGRAMQGGMNAIFGPNTDPSSTPATPAPGQDPRGQGPNGPNGRGANNPTPTGT
jgi:hypothetical protein